MLLRSGIIVAFYTLISRVFGFIREFLIAAIFGTSALADCVNVAFKFPNLFRRVFGEGALSASFIPIFSEKLYGNIKWPGQIFASKVFTLLVFVLMILTLVVEIIMPYIVLVISPGFYNDKEKFELAVTLCRITTPYLIFVSVTALFGAILNTIRRFAAFAFVPIIMNLCVIIIAYFLQEPNNAAYGICYSLIFAGILQVMFMYYYLNKFGFNLMVIFAPKEKEVVQLIKNMGPATLSSGAQQLNLFISSALASFLPGAVSVLSYADRLYQLPLALIGVTFSTILLPRLSFIYKEKNFDQANYIQNKSIQIGLMLSVPAMIGLFALSKPIIHIIYERGYFSAEDTIRTAEALAAFTFGLPSFIIAKIITPIYYANLDTRTPYRIALYSLFINTVLNIILMIPFGHIGIALGSSIAGWINAFLLYKYAKQYGDFQITKETKNFVFKVSLSSLCMMMFITLIVTYYDYMFYSNVFLVKLGVLCGTIIGSIIIFLAVSYFLKMHIVLLKKLE